MTDICERLVRFAGKVCISTDTEVEAADTIKDLRAENARLQQVSALTCDKCGWAMQFPGEECRNCGYERLRAENARLLAALSDILNYTGGANNALEDEYVMERARAAMGESE